MTGSKKPKAAASGITRRSVLAAATAAATVAPMASPFRINILRAQARPIRIGFPVPLTGPYGAEAQEQVRCAEIAVDQFNASGGLDGRKAELLVRDDKLKPGEAATRTLELIEKDGVDFVVGSLSASVQLAVNEICKARGVLYNSISQSDSINEVPHFSKYTFHEAMNPTMTTWAVGQHVFPNSGKRVAFLVADYAYGHEMVRGFKRVGAQYGIETVAEVLHPIAAKDFTTFLPQIIAAQPDVLCLCNFGYDQLNSIKQAAGFGMKEQMLLVAPVLLFNQRLAGGDVYEGVVGGANYYWPIEADIPSAKAFNDAYRERNQGRPPSDYGAYGYGGVAAVLEAVRRAGTTETERVIEAMEGMEYDLYKGRQYYRRCDHQSVQSVFVIRAKANADMQGEWDVFDIVSVAEASEDMLRTCAELGHEG